jgi:hypothetical protein
VTIELGGIATTEMGVYLDDTAVCSVAEDQERLFVRVHPESPSPDFCGGKPPRVERAAIDGNVYPYHDSPPILAASDALVLRPYVDGILIVLRARATPYDHARHAITSFLALQTDPLVQDERETIGRNPRTSRRDGTWRLSLLYL